MKIKIDLNHPSAAKYMFERFVPRECIIECSAPGPVDQAIRYWLSQLDLRVDPGQLAAHLREYGAWDESGLANHEDNLARLLWLTCCDIKEEGLL